MKEVFVIKSHNGTYWEMGVRFNENIYNAMQFDKYEIAQSLIRELLTKDFKGVTLFLQVDKFFTT